MRLECRKGVQTMKIDLQVGKRNRLIAIELFKNEPIYA